MSLRAWLAATTPAVLLRTGAISLLVMTLSATATAADDNRQLAAAASAIDHALASSSIPGLVIGITDRRELRQVIVHGYADVKTRAPLTPDSRFAIGSISKAFTAIALLQLAQEGRFDPHAPIHRYLPGFEVHSRFAPITGHHLLSHTSGLPGYLADSASSRIAFIELRDFEPSYAPGAHFWYSNTGFQLLGYTLENIERERYPRVIQRRVLEPLGMTATSAVLDDAQRTQMVVSYARWPYDDKFVEAPWFEYTAGDGSIVSNVADMCAYVRMFLNRGIGPHGRLLSEKAFALLTTPVLENYAYGVEVTRENGHTVIAHGGGIAGYRSAVEAHVDEGFGLVFLSSAYAGLAPPLVKWVEEVVAAAFGGPAAPPVPAWQPTPVSPDLRDYVGEYKLQGKNGVESAETLKVGFAPGGLAVEEGQKTISLQKMGMDAFRALGESGDNLPFFFWRGGKDQHGKVVEVSHGTLWYASNGFQERVQPPAPKEYGAFVGHFENNGPEGPVARVFVRNGRLMMLESLDEPLTPLPLEPMGSGLFRVGDETYSPERARFGDTIEGHALRLSLSGDALYRKDTP